MKYDEAWRVPKGIGPLRSFRDRCGASQDQFGSERMLTPDQPTRLDIPKYSKRLARLSSLSRVPGVVIVYIER